MTKVTQLPIDKIGFDPEYYPRVNGKPDWLTIHRYKEALETNPWKADHTKLGAFPPVIVVKATGYDWPYLLLDGVHRQSAFGGAGHSTIPAIIEKLPQSKWLERSVELNIDSKRPLDSGDKRWIATKLKAEGWEDGKIADLLCMKSGSFDKLMATGVQKLTKPSAKKITSGRSHRQIGDQHVGFLKSPFVGTSGTANAQEALSHQSAVTARAANQIIESFIALLESRAVDITDEHTMNRLKRAGRLVDEIACVAIA